MWKNIKQKTCSSSTCCQQMRHKGRSVVVLDLETVTTHIEKSPLNLNSLLQVVRSDRGKQKQKKSSTETAFLALTCAQSHLHKVKYHSELHGAAVAWPRGDASPSKLSPDLIHSQCSASISLLFTCTLSVDFIVILLPVSYLWVQTQSGPRSARISLFRLFWLPSSELLESLPGCSGGWSWSWSRLGASKMLLLLHAARLVERKEQNK